MELRASAGWDDTDEGRAERLYAPYVQRQNQDRARTRGDRQIRIAPKFNFQQVPGLSSEMAERLGAARPETLDQASRVRGITPAALAALYIAVGRVTAA